MGQISLAMRDSPLKSALDAYYTFLVELIKPSASERISINNIITPADMYDNTNFYNQYIFRQFVDRSIISSPTDYTLGNANSTSAYSYHWSNLLERVIGDIDINLAPENQLKLDELDRQISEFRDKQLFTRSDLITRWNEFAEIEGITKEDKYYIFKKKKFADDGGWATQLSNYRREIYARLTKQNQIRLSAMPDQEDRIIVQTYQYAIFDEYKLTLPRIPDFEQVDGLTASDLTNLAVTGSSGDFESEADIRPVGNIRNFFSPTAPYLEIKLDHTSDTQHKHDSEWKTSASGSYSFFSASVSAEHEKHITESLHKIRKITVGFANIADYEVRRGKWFNETLLGYKRIVEVLENDKLLAGLLQRTISSLILGRGLTIKLEFSDVASLERWEKTTFGGSGGIQMFGIGFGGSGSGYEYDWSLKKSTAAQTITIADDPRYARVLGHRTQPVGDMLSEDEIYKDWQDPQYYSDEIMTSLGGKRSIADYTQDNGAEIADQA